ncbi:unnamed protein product, partial [Timema podura]|nr:unnamed protein product [Timema podura]
MTSQLRADTVVTYCNATLGRNKQFVAEVSEEERYSWMWALLFSFLAPELCTLFRSARMCFFKSFEKPKWKEFSIVFLMETLHTVGIGLLVFVILPYLDVIKGAMLTNCVCFVPALLAIFSRGNEEFSELKSKKIGVGKMKLSVDLLAAICQGSGLLIWPLLNGIGNLELWLIPVAVFCISCGWWENYVTLPRNIDSKSLQALRKFMKRLMDNRYRYYTYIFVSLWKMIIFFGMTVLTVYAKDSYQPLAVSKMFTNFKSFFSLRHINVTEIRPVLSGTGLPDLNDVTPASGITEMEAWHMAPIWVFVIHFFSAYLCYIFGKFACKIRIQTVSFAFPINLAVPVTVSLLALVCGLRTADPCVFSGVIPDYLFFNSPDIYNLGAFLTSQHVWAWLLWLGSQMWITIHLWTPQSDPLSSTEKLFVTPLYSSFLIDQSLGMNRRRNDKDFVVRLEDVRDINDEFDEIEEDVALDEKHPAKGNTEFMSNTLLSEHVQPMDSITRVYACATMWHETREEMTCMIKSLLRMDVDHAIRKYLQKHLELVDPNYYEFETHILFDDAFERKDGEYIINQYVKDFMKTMNETVQSFHGIRLQPPTAFPTPYGGRLVWTLPGKTKILVHLKDKDKIRHRKRWSQVMYMYYLLGHRIMELPIHIDRKAVIAQNTYILAMDGDVDFQPQAVHLLIDLMKKNDTLGSSCGRIHPIGQGAMAWYQLFEYAVGHWLQKATEHMIGCVLCSPGAFSLFRARALMDDGVMKRYTFTANEPRHYVQYDQGEDRWLCTLLLQQGYRVEYSAASDAYTHCPESFDEFYNQRRRWVPSTMANIFDLLGSAKKTSQINDNISLPYIFYHVIMMAGSILGPGTIFLMLVGAFVSAFKIGNMVSFEYNIIPVFIFILTCSFCSSKIQLFMAMIISTVYGLVMMAVVVGIALQIKEDGPLAPASMFFFVFAGELIIAGLLHPREINCLPAMLIYYITVPSMYMLLILYSLFNMNNISWGTREAPVTPGAGKTKKEIEEEKKKAEEEAKLKKKKTPFFGFLQGNNKSPEEEGSIEFSLAGLFKCMLCTHPKSVDDKLQLARIAESINSIGRRIEMIERRIDPTAPSRRRGSMSINGHTVSLQEEPEEEDSYSDSIEDMGGR